MVRGGGARGWGNKRKFGGKSQGLTKQQKTHWKKFGEVHPADERYSHSYNDDIVLT